MLAIILVANLLVAAIKIIIGSIIKSASMTADGFHSVSGGSSNIIGLVGIHFAFQAGDVGYEIFRDNSHILLDGEAIDSEDIKDVVMRFEEVKDIHKIRSRSSINIIYIDLHLVVDPELDVEESHNLVHDIEDAIKVKFNKNLQLIAHVEPYEYRTTTIIGPIIEI